jgi:hypothetical protein
MGHITVVSDDLADAKKKARQVQAVFKVVSE